MHNYVAICQYLKFEIGHELGKLLRIQIGSVCDKQVKQLINSNKAKSILYRRREASLRHIICMIEEEK